MAHEIGHNFGALHDGEGNNECTKPWNKGIMGSMCYKFGKKKLDFILMDTRSRFWDKKRSLFLDWFNRFKYWIQDKILGGFIMESTRNKYCLTLADEFSSETINYDVVTHKFLPQIFPNPC